MVPLLSHGKTKQETVTHKIVSIWETTTKREGTEGREGERQAKQRAAGGRENLCVCMLHGFCGSAEEGAAQ